MDFSRFKFWYEKFLFRFSFIFAFFAFLSLFVYAYMSDLTIKLPGEQAPFTKTLINEQKEATIAPDQRTLPLDKPHRTPKELESWSTMVVAEALSFDQESYPATLRQVRPYFTAEGFQQYKDYLASSGILNSMKEKDYQVSMFLEEKPLQMNSGAVKDIYRWLYQLPVTVSFVPRGSSNPFAEGNLVNRKLKLQVQIRRVKIGDDPNALQIESWTASGRR